MRKLISMVAAGALLASTTVAFAADAQSSSSNSAQPLAPGAAAGVHNAQLFEGSTGLWVAGGLILVGIGTYVVLNQSSHTSTTNSTH